MKIVNIMTSFYFALFCKCPLLVYQTTWRHYLLYLIYVTYLLYFIKELISRILCICCTLQLNQFLLQLRFHSHFSYNLSIFVIVFFFFLKCWRYVFQCEITCKFVLSEFDLLTITNFFSMLPSPIPLTSRSTCT